MIKYFD
jgi:uncharacterized protein YqkB